MSQSVYDKVDFLSRNYDFKGYSFNDKGQFYLLINFFFEERCQQFLRDFGTDFKVLKVFNLLGTNFNNQHKNVQEIRFNKNIDEIANEVTIDAVDSTGYLTGWIFFPGFDQANVFIEDENVGKIMERELYFSYDLLVHGCYPGNFRFRLKVPTNYLDGSQKKIKINIDVGNKELSYVRKIKFPFFPNKKFAEVLDVQGTDWELARKELIDNFDVIKLRMLIDQDDSAQFLVKDIGLMEFFNVRGRPFPSFKKILKQRNDLYFDGIKCNEKKCCKKIKFSHNKFFTHEQDSSLNDLHGFNCPWKLRNFAVKDYTRFLAITNGWPVARQVCIEKSTDLNVLLSKRNYVLKPNYGSGVDIKLVFNDVNLMSGLAFDKSDALSFIDKTINSGGQVIYEEMLVQEGVAEDIPFIPLDYKFHCFGGKARFVTVYNRNISTRSQSLYQHTYSRDFCKTIDGIRDEAFTINKVAKPACYEQMVSIADEVLNP